MNRRAGLFLLLYLAAILYLSLYPWRFVANGSFRSLGWVPLATRRTILDAFLNVVFYLPLGAAAFVTFRRGFSAFLAAIILGISVSFSVELAQLSIPTRFGNLTDLLCNTAGTLLGIGVVLAATRPPLASILRALSSPGVLLVGLWVIWQAFTLVPRYGPMIDISHEIVGLIVLVSLVVRRHFRIVAILLLIWLAVDELRPFRFEGPAQPFWWLPFESWFAGALESYYGTFFGKLFLYTAILWAERRSELQWIWALVPPAAILFAGELAQRYLPGRTPEITDVFILAAGAVLLRLAEPSDNKGQA